MSLASESQSPRSHYHRAFGLVVRSDVPLPELLPASADATVDVDIHFGEVPETLPGPRARNIFFDVAGERMLVRMPGVARYLLESGRSVTVAPRPGAPEEDVRAYLFTIIFGALLLQRGDLVLHGSAVAVRGQGVGFLGASGYGKSTLAAGFHRRGYPVLTDDLCVVRPSVAGGWAIQPGFPHMKLWLDSLEKLDLSPEGLRRIRHKEEKRALPITGGFATEPLPVKKFYLLRRAEQDKPVLRPLEGPRKLAALANHTYRRGMLVELEQAPGHFQQTVELARVVSIAMAVRPAQAFQLEELIALIEADLGT